MIHNDKKVCSRCYKEKFLFEFRKKTMSKDGKKSYCITCDDKYQKERYNKNRKYFIGLSRERYKKKRKQIKEKLLEERFLRRLERLKRKQEKGLL